MSGPPRHREGRRPPRSPKPLWKRTPTVWVWTEPDGGIDITAIGVLPPLDKPPIIVGFVTPL